MKLLFCDTCMDVFSLSREEKSCSCGKARGQYTDELNAVYSGGTPLGFANNTFVKAIKNQPQSGWGKEFIAFVIPVDCSNFKKSCQDSRNQAK